MFNRLFIARAAFLSAGAALQLHAAEPASIDSEPTLQTVTITSESNGGSLTVPSLAEARSELAAQPGGTALVDAEQYKRGRATTLKDALDFAPGVFIQPRFGAEESRFSIRGSGIQRTFHGRGIKLLQDGVPLNLADGGFDFQAVEPLATRYIEIFRGANALEFGSTTLGGAVNFVSLTGHEAPAFSARLEYGSFESYRAQLSSGGISGAFDSYVSLSHFSSDGFREHSQQNNQRLFANFGYRLSAEVETRFFITASQTDSELPGELTRQQLEDDPQQAGRVPAFLRGLQPVARFDRVTSNWKRDFELLRISNRTTWQRGDQRLTLGSFWAHKNLDHPILFVIDQLSNDFGIDLRYDQAGDVAGHRNHFALGFAATYGVLEDQRFLNNFGNRGARLGDQHQTAANLDLYLQDRFYFTPTLALVLGGQITRAQRESDDEFARVDGIDNSDERDYWGYSPKLGVLWNVTPDAQVFANVSRSFEPPSFGELGNATNNGTGLVELDPQTATTIEVGTRGRYGRFQWDLAYYHAWLDDELLEFQVQPGLTQITNAGRTIHQGVEAALEVDLLTGIFTRGGTSNSLAPTTNGKSAALSTPVVTRGDRVVLRQVYLWNDFRFDGDAEFGDRRLPGIPEHYYRAEMIYEHPRGFYGGPNVEWVPAKYNLDSAETEFANPYALLGFKIGYRSTHRLSLFIEAKNLIDKRHAATTGVVSTFRGQALFFPGEGRGFFGGLEWKW